MLRLPLRLLRLLLLRLLAMDSTAGAQFTKLLMLDLRAGFSSSTQTDPSRNTGTQYLSLHVQ